jgi:site-specific DNA-methyltransferase (adenine-specific)
MDIHNLDCFDYFKKVSKKSVNLFILDLPYATTNWGKTTACKWDTPIDLDKMWIEIKRIMKKNANIIFFCNTKFGFNLIESNKKWFKYSIIWKKSRKVGFLTAAKKPLVQKENIYIFKNAHHAVTYNPQMEEGEAYNYNPNGIHTEKEYLKNSYYDSNMKFKPNENNGTRHPTDILEYDADNIYIFKKDITDKERHTYNSQKIELDKPVKLHRSTENYGKIYENKYMKERTNTKTYTDEHPTDILEFSNPSKSIHKTQKPVDLLEWLIKSYSNEGDLICDFTFGSGSTAIACLNTKRRFTGCERDTDIFKMAKQRIEEHNVEEFKKEQEERKKKEIKKKIKEYKKFIEKHKT